MVVSDVVNSLAPTSSTLPTSLGVAVLLAYGMDLLKRLKSIPKVTYYTAKLNAVIRLVTAGVSTLGISWVWSSLPNGAHQWVIDIPAWSAVGIGLFHWGTQFGIQHGWEILLGLRPVAQSAMVAQAKE